MSADKTIYFAKEIRIHTLKMTSNGGSSHIGSIFSIADLLAVLFFDFLNLFPNEPKKISRDRFILSKGHAGAGVYAALAMKGFFSIAKLNSHFQNGSLLSGHVSHKGIDGVEFSTGSLGHGLPVSIGMALTAKIDKLPYKVVCLLSDGELNEGSNWESMLLANHFSLDNLIAIVDRNKLQSFKSTEETLALEPLVEKVSSFGWKVVEIDGHNHQEIKESLSSGANGKPLFIIANTIKGKGVKFMENKVLWHYRTARGEEFDKALKELQES